MSNNSEIVVDNHLIDFQGDKNRATVLIIDDNLVNLQVLANILKDEGYKVAMIKDGLKAFHFAKKRIPDIILLDIMMPGTNGFEVCHKLKSNKETKDIPVIFISALIDTENKLKGFELGGVDYITKPFQSREVLARVSTHLCIRNLQKKLQEQNMLLQQEVIERKKAEEKLRRAKEEVEKANQFLEERVQEELTKRLKQQQLLIQKSKLESLGKLAAGIAHEINQPLSVIQMGLDNILFKLFTDKLTKEYLEKKISYLREDIDRINNIINHIRIFSRDQTTVLFENVDVNESCKNALSIIQTQYKHHDVKIILDLDNTIGFTLGNKYKLEQVILNLISNAKYAVDEKSHTINNSFYQKEIKIKTFSYDNQICLEIEDNGTGISKENKENIFDPFFTTKSPEQGTGLGLSISYGIIKEMKGDIDVKSQLDEYTIMKISLPKISI